MDGDRQRLDARPSWWAIFYAASSSISRSMYSWMAAIGTRLVRPILTLLILCFLTNSQAAVRPMLSICAASPTDTRMGFDSMNFLPFGADTFLSCRCSW
jgi:hypothetical protein